MVPLASLLQYATNFISVHWIALLVGFLGFFTYWQGVMPYLVFKKLGIPGPTPLPFIGNSLRSLVTLSRLPHLHVEWGKKYGKVYGTYFFRAPFLVVSDVEMIKQISVKEFAKFHDRKSVIEVPEPYNRMLTVATGQKWRDIRNTLSPSFSASKMKEAAEPKELGVRNRILNEGYEEECNKMMFFMNEAVDTLLKKVDRATKTGEIVDFHRWLQALTLEVILSTAFGVKAETQVEENDPLTNKARKVMAPNIVVGLLMLLPFGDKLLKLLPDPFFFNEMGAVASDIITERMATSNYRRRDMLQLMLDASENGNKLEKDDIAPQCLIFLLAGYDTSSSVLGFTCHSLATNTDVQDKLREEIDRVWSDDEDTPSYDVLHQMEYLDWVISETLRMYPPGFVIQRECIESCTVGGFHFPKDMSIFFPVYAIHHDPEHWKDPEKFDPTRFSEAEKAKRHPYAYLPFGHGPRSCIGMRFALLEIKLTLVRLLKKFRLDRTEKTKVPINFSVGGVLTCPRGSVMLKAVSRV